LTNAVTNPLKHRHQCFSFQQLKFAEPGEAGGAEKDSRYATVLRAPKACPGIIISREPASGWPCHILCSWTFGSLDKIKLHRITFCQRLESAASD
jgi:hypothetical protein